MDKASAASVGASSRYAVLAANASKVISASSKRELEPVEKKLLHRAAELLDKIVQGSQFIEHREAHVLSDPRENLFAFEHAMSAIRRMDLTSNSEGGLTSIFTMLQADLRRLSNGERIEEGSRTAIRGFFDALGDLFYRDIADISVTIQESDFERTLA